MQSNLIWRKCTIKGISEKIRLSRHHRRSGIFIIIYVRTFFKAQKKEEKKGWPLSPRRPFLAASLTYSLFWVIFYKDKTIRRGKFHTHLYKESGCETGSYKIRVRINRIRIQKRSDPYWPSRFFSISIDQSYYKIFYRIKKIRSDPDPVYSKDQKIYIPTLSLRTC